MYKAIITLNENTDYNILTMAGDKPDGLTVEDSNADIIVTAKELFVV